MIGNRDYSRRRKEPGFDGFIDLPSVLDDLQEMRQGLVDLGVKSDEIYVLFDTDFSTLSEQVMKKAGNLIAANWENGQRRTLVFLYYAGHGVLQNVTKAVCNKPDLRNRVFYPLESNLRVLGTRPGAFVIGLFDCCRSKFTRQMRSCVQDEANKSGNYAGDEDYRNCILTFACAPNSQVNATSTLAREFLRTIRRSQK